MKVIPLTKGEFSFVDYEDYELLNKYKWHFSRGYVARRDKNGRNIYMHKQITGLNKTDHENRIRLDNRRVNLRKYTTSQNTMNR